MQWLGHADSAMVRRYFHLYSDQARRHMNQVDFLGRASGRSAGNDEDQPIEEDVESPKDDNESN